MTGDFKPLTEKQRAVARALASGVSGSAACSEYKINEVTLYRWRKLPQFQILITELIEGFDRQAMQSLQSLRSKAVARLGDLLRSHNPTVALRAAEAILTRTERIKLPESWAGVSADSTTWNQVQDELERIRTLPTCETPA